MNPYELIGRTVPTKRGEMTLLSIDETSDGYLIGWAEFDDGEERWSHSVFLGRNITCLSGSDDC